MSLFEFDIRRSTAPALSAGAFLALASASGCAITAPEPTLVVHTIDDSIWLWARPGRSIRLYFDVDESFSVCDKMLTADAKEELATRSDFLIGEACGGLVVLFRPLPVALNDAARQILAVHEAFHAAVQMHNLLPRIDVVDDPGEPGEIARENIDSFLGTLPGLLTGERHLNGNACARIKAGYLALPLFEREYVDYKSYWEWPAEFYTRETALKQMSVAEYRALRKALFLNDLKERVYFTGALAMESIDRAIPREQWQRRYKDGETILNLFAESLGCSPVHRPTLQVDSIAWGDIFTDVVP